MRSRHVHHRFAWNLDGKRLAISVTLCVWLLLIMPIAASQSRLQKSVLIINEVGLVHPASALVTQQLMSQLATSHAYQLEVYIESLDSTLFADEASQRKTEAGLIQKYQNRKLDVIVAMGPTAIKFLSGVSSTFLPKVPVVFCGSTEEQAGHPKLDSRFTGTWLKLEPAKTLDAALRLSPETRHIVVVGGTSTFDKGLEAITRAGLNSYPVSLDIIYLTNLELSSLLERLRHLPNQTVVLYVSFFRDAAGSQFVNTTTLPLVSDAANAPVFGMSDTYLGHGAVGGYVVSFAEQGKVAARIVSELFDGRRAQDIPIIRGSNSYMFDWRQLRRWGLSESKLPSGSAILYREPTIWERVKWLMLMALLVILGLAFVTGYLLYNQKQLKLAREEQVRLSGMLINAQEEERSRLASELHDDFSQRLAVLSLGLETVAEMIPESPQEANRQLHELMNAASEIGADLHTLSHRLHSSTLERLGLAPGVGAFCKEFAAQQRVQVNFSHVNVPPSVDPAVALCLFRVVQEGLRNVTKHSRAASAQVRLEAVKEIIHLSISDQGIGFDVRELGNKRGLGIRSMQERMHLIGGRFELHSEPQKGTHIDVWANFRPQELKEAVNQTEVR